MGQRRQKKASPEEFQEDLQGVFSFESMDTGHAPLLIWQLQLSQQLAFEKLDQFFLKDPRRSVPFFGVKTESCADFKLMQWLIVEAMMGWT